MAAGMLLIDEEMRRAMRRERVFRERGNYLDKNDDRYLNERYRMSRGAIVSIFEIIKDDLLTVTNRSHAIDPQIQLLIALRYYAKGGFLSETGDLHGVSRSSVSCITKRVTDGIIHHLRGMISFPADVLQLKEGFYAIAHIPNVVGAIDGTLIPIIAPSADEHTYVCRKGFHALNIQAVVDSRCRFINIVARWPGSVHDSFILNNSNLSAVFERREIDGWLLGDSGYPLRPWLLTPIANPTTHADDRYNRAHKKTRSVVERAFGLL
ncbi:putative nuclease HARBI1 [Pecten maximus]|uniref:putative nuclease HARBI1 n=1 Tax=Pecten maximus TaxID=6579 RepID=UPI00145846B0|nr:putative nuclease HARBI1 [Pecten maximus]